MNTEFKNGNVILARNILNDNFLDVSEIATILKKDAFYIIDSKKYGRVLKNIEKEGNILKLTSLNKEYLPLIIENPCDDIIRIFEVSYKSYLSKNA